MKSSSLFFSQTHDARHSSASKPHTRSSCSPSVPYLRIQNFNSAAHAVLCLCDCCRRNSCWKFSHLETTSPEVESIFTTWYVCRLKPIYNSIPTYQLSDGCDACSVCKSNTGTSYGLARWEGYTSVVICTRHTQSESTAGAAQNSRYKSPPLRVFLLSAPHSSSGSCEMAFSSYDAVEASLVSKLQRPASLVGC
jgi:hypothetical protein